MEAKLPGEFWTVLAVMDRIGTLSTHTMLLPTNCEENGGPMMPTNPPGTWRARRYASNTAMGSSRISSLLNRESTETFKSKAKLSEALTESAARRAASPTVGDWSPPPQTTTLKVGGRVPQTHAGR
jgi:hypothetical protein